MRDLAQEFRGVAFFLERVALIGSANDLDLVRHLERQRLLTEKDENIRLVHEALLVGWPRLRRFIEGAKADIAFASRIERLAADAKEGSGLLSRDDAREASRRAQDATRGPSGRG